MDIVIVCRRLDSDRVLEGGYGIGDVVAVYDESKDPGGSPVPEIHPRHFVLRVNEIPSAVGSPDEDALINIRDVLTEYNDNEGSPQETLNRRRWYLDVASMPAASQNAILIDGYFADTWANLQPYVTRKATDAEGSRPIGPGDL